MKDETEKERRIRIAKGWVKGGPRLRGKKEYEKFLDGKKLTYKQSVWARCYMCTDGWDLQNRGCTDPTCPLVPICPYQPKPKKDAAEKI